MSMPEPKIAVAIETLYKSGWYMTFMYEHRISVEAAQNGTEIMRLFLRHILEQAVNSHLSNVIRERLQARSHRGK